MLNDRTDLELSLRKTLARSYRGRMIHGRRIFELNPRQNLTCSYDHTCRTVVAWCEEMSWPELKVYRTTMDVDDGHRSSMMSGAFELSRARAAGQHDDIMMQRSRGDHRAQLSSKHKTHTMVIMGVDGSGW